MAVQIITTVTTAAASYDLVDLPTVKDDLGITVGTSDATLKRYISAASAAASNYCNRVFQQETLSEVFNLTWARLQWGGAPLLQTTRWPVMSVTSVMESLGLNAVSLIAGTDYTIDKTTGQLLRLDPVTGLVTRWTISPVTIVYSAGFSPIPLDVQDAVSRMVRTRWFAKMRDPLIRQQTIPGVLEQQFWVPTGTEAGNVTPDVADLLTNYRLPVIA
jgi:hypothetical protein